MALMDWPHWHWGSRREGTTQAGYSACQGTGLTASSFRPLSKASARGFEGLVSRLTGLAGTLTSLQGTTDWSVDNRQLPGVTVLEPLCSLRTIDESGSVLPVVFAADRTRLPVLLVCRLKCGRVAAATGRSE